jgi:hypothetical protein
MFSSKHNINAYLGRSDHWHRFWMRKARNGRCSESEGPFTVNSFQERRWSTLPVLLRDGADLEMYVDSDTWHKINYSKIEY